MKKKTKLLLFVISILFVGLLSSCTISLVKEDIEKQVTLKEKPKLRNIAREYNGLTWNEYVNLEKDNEYYGYFENEVNLSEFQTEYRNDNPIWFQEYHCVYFYGLGGCENSNVYKKDFCPIVYKDKALGYRIVKPTDVIDKNKSYEYWNENLNVTYDARLHFLVNSGFETNNCYISDSEDFEKSLDYSEYITPQKGRNIVIEFKKQDFVDDVFLLFNDMYSNTNEKLMPNEDEKFIIPLEKVGYYEFYLKAYELENDLEKYVSKHNGTNWWVVDSSFYFTNQVRASDFSEKKDKFLFQDYHIIGLDADGKEFGEYKINPIVYKNENDKYEFVFSSDIIDENIKYEYYDESMDIELYSYIEFVGEKNYDKLDAYLVDEKDASKVLDNNYYIFDQKYTDLYSYYVDNYDKRYYFKKDETHYLAIKLDEFDNATTKVIYYYDYQSMNKKEATIEDGYYWIELNGNGKYVIEVQTEYLEPELDTIKEEFNGYPWSVIRKINPYYSSKADFQYLIGDYPYFEKSRFEMDFIPIWFDSKASGEFYDSSFDLLMYEHDGVYDFVRDTEIIDSNIEYVYLSDVIEKLFDCSEFYLEWDQNVYTVEVGYVDNLDFSAMFTYNGVHFAAKKGRMIALKIYSDNPNTKYLDLKITYKGKPTTLINGYFLIEYKGDTRCLFDCEIIYNGVLDHESVDLDELIKQYSGQVFDYLYGKETKEAVENQPFKYSYLEDLYEKYKDYLNYKDNLEEVLWWYNDEASDYTPVIEYTDEESFEFVTKDDKIKDNGKYDYWDKEKENKNKKDKKNFKLEVNNKGNKNIKAYLMDNYNYYNLYDYDFNKNIKVGQQLVVYIDPNVDVKITYGEEELERKEYYGFYVFDFVKYQDYVINII